MKPRNQVDIVVIGAGVVGCAVAAHLSEQFKGRTLVILEAGPRIAEGVTSRNSGVVHAGIYYPPDSLKAQSCIEGNSLLYEWAEKHHVPIKKLGKLIVASSEKQVAGLEKIFSNAQASGAKNLRMLNPYQVKELEPSLEMEAALFSPETGIVDQFELTRSFVHAMELNGGILMLNHAVTGITSLPSGNYEITAGEEIIESPWVINAAGLHSDEIAKLAGVEKYEIYPCRGDYFSFKPAVSFQHLIYPVKEPGAPGLGVHLTIDIGGRYKLGPDTEYVSSKSDFKGGEHKLPKFQEAAQKLFGKIGFSQLQYDSCGIRPKLRAPWENEEKDFVVSQDKPGLINMVGIESPGLTASLALARRVGEIMD